MARWSCFGGTRAIDRLTLSLVSHTTHVLTAWMLTRCARSLLRSLPEPTLLVLGG